MNLAQTDAAVPGGPTGPRLPIFSWAVVVLAIAIAPVGCGREAAVSPLPNLLVVTFDTTRADHLGAYGYFRDTSPRFDELARTSLLFERAIAPMATTLPTHLSIFTASYPLEHGVLANTTHGGRLFVPNDALRSFASHAQGLGYRTGAFVSAAPLKRGTGIEVGFESFDQPAGHERSGAATTDRAIAWLADGGSAPFLLWVHYFDAHWPFTPPPSHAGRFRVDGQLEAYISERRIAETAPRPLAGIIERSRDAIDAYDAEILFQDDQLARLLDAVRERGAWEDTSVLVIGDHGEGLGQHGEAGHGGTWDEQLHVPMLIRVPGVEPRRIGETISVVDALPTWLGQLGVPELSAFVQDTSGRDVLAVGAAAAPLVLSQDTGRERGSAAYRYALTSDTWKYFRVEQDGEPVRDQLFDLEKDPFELSDLADTKPRETAMLRRQLEARMAELRARGEALRSGRPPATVEASPEVLEQLRALGYLVDEPEAAP
jgi:arylsulfatase